VFLVLATANSGGYRYGISDQAYYVPAAMKAADPGLFPRDSALLDVQSRLLVIDETLAAASALPGFDMPLAFFTLYLASVIALFGAAVAFARACRLSAWATAAFLLLLTFRHRIPRTGANSLEGYAHPRMLAFALGIAALACIVRSRYGWAALWVAAAAAVHPTTGCWFAVVVAAAAFAARPEWRRALMAGVAALAAVGTWALLAGAPAERLVRMDDAWLAVLADKDYLFPTDWPLYAWVLNLMYPAVVLLVSRARARSGLAVPGERGLMAGVAALVALFAISVPLTALEMALAVQLQVTRVFWVLDLLAAAAVAWWLTSAEGARSTLRPAIVVAVLAAASIGRGVFLLVQPEPNRELVQIDLPQTPWAEAMRWLGAQPASWHVLADPGHAWKYGVSVRLAAGRDTVVELGKDSSMAMYDRDLAMRVAERSAALADFEALDAARASQLGERYNADVLVVEHELALDLPVLYGNDGFVIHDLRR
jgi:hypothetical protein